MQKKIGGSSSVALTLLAFTLSLSMASVSYADGLYSKWDDPADASIHNELSRAILIEKVENDFFQESNNYTTIYDNSNNVTNCETQGSCQSNSNSTIGNITDIDTENCTGDGACTAKGSGDLGTENKVEQDNRGNQRSQNQYQYQQGNNSKYVND